MKTDRTWIVLIILCTLLAATVLFIAVLLIQPVWQSWKIRVFASRAVAGDVVLFDPDESLAIFVRMTAGTMDDARFKAAIPGFRDAVMHKLHVLSARTGTVIVPPDAILAAPPKTLPDMTTQITREVYDGLQ